MIKRCISMGAVLGIWLAVSGCSTISMRVGPHANLSNLKHLYVVHLLTDGRGVDQAITRELRHRGYNATFGPRTEMPEDVDAAVVYSDTWASDFTTYMISIQLEIRTPRTDYPLAVAYARRPSVLSQPPQVLIDKLIFKLFPAKPALPDLPFHGSMPDFGNTIAPAQ